MAHRGDEDRWPPAAGEPVPHGLVNVGDETVKVVGFFSESEIRLDLQGARAAVRRDGREPGRPGPHACLSRDREE